MQSKTVLIVDDEKGFLQILQIILQRAGYQTLVASNTTEALQLIEKMSPTAVILDDDMPGMTGGELCRRLKTNPRTRYLHVVMFSANDRIRDPQYLAEIQADDAIRKPAMPADILSALEPIAQPPAHV